MNHTAPNITIAYVMKGFFGSAGYLGQTLLGKKTLQQIITGVDDAEIDAVGWIVELAVLVEEAWTALPVDSYYGVWDYEISEPFGNAVAEYAIEHSDLPNAEWARAKIQALIKNSGGV